MVDSLCCTKVLKFTIECLNLNVFVKCTCKRMSVCMYVFSVYVHIHYVSEFKGGTYITPATYFMPLYRVQILLKVEPGDRDQLVSVCETKQEHNDETEAMEEGRHTQVDLLSPRPAQYLSHTATDVNRLNLYISALCRIRVGKIRIF